MAPNRHNTARARGARGGKAYLLFDDMHFIIVLPLVLDDVVGLRLHPRPLLGGSAAIQPCLVGQFLLFCHGATLIMHLEATGRGLGPGLWAGVGSNLGLLG